MQLIIVESPTKAKTLERFLGDKYRVLATKGHIKDLPKSRLSIDLEKDFEPMYEPVEKKKEVIDKIIKVSKSAGKIFLATDPDREGEAIASHIYDLLNAKKANDKKIRRIVFHEITPEAVNEAIAKPRKIDVHLVNAQIARRVLDRLVGYKLSPLLWKKVRRGLSAGRVQTVAVRLIVEKEKEIEAFKSEEYWEIFCKVKAVFTSEVKGACTSEVDESREFEIQLVKINGKKAVVNNESEAAKIVADLKRGEYKVSDIRKREVNKHPYPPFTTSTMTQAAAGFYSWSAKRTMRAAQGLYEEGLITYHRTDSFNLSAGAVAKARSYIKSKFGEKYLPEEPVFYKTRSKSAQEAHEAIRPTDVGQDPRSKIQDPNDGRKLYELIWKRFLACQMAASVYDETVVGVEARTEITSQVKGTPTWEVYILRAGGQILKFDGWKRLYSTSDGGGELVESNSSEVNVLPELTVGDPLTLTKVNPVQKFTQPPARYSEASLIKTLEALGIGRPSTYAPIISTIQVRQYVEKKEGRFFPTKVGIAVNDFLIPHFGTVFDYQFTAQMESGLDDVAGGKKKWREEIKTFYRPFEKILAKVEKTAGRVKIETEKVGRKCPDCKEGDLVIRIGRFGKFISCSGFPDCKHTERLVERMNMKCPDCTSAGRSTLRDEPSGSDSKSSVPIGEVIVKKTKTGRRFYGCSRYPDCSWASWKKPVK